MKLTALARQTVKDLIKEAIKTKCELYDIENDKWDRDDLLGNFILESAYLEQEDLMLISYKHKRLILTKAQQKELQQLEKEDDGEIEDYPIRSLFDLTIQPMLKKELLKYGELPYN